MSDKCERKSVNLRPVWDATLDVYREIARVCDKHGLRYYLTDGTAIGAVRHKGFIPWDDDFDMSMPRNDYERFVELAKRELPPHLKFVNWKNTPEFSLLFGQVHDCRRDKISKVEKACGYMLSLGIYVDIFPIDGYPESSLERWFVRKYAYLLRALWRAKGGVYKNQSRRGKVLMVIGRILSVLFPWLRTTSDIMIRCEQLQKKHEFAGSKNSSRASVYLTGLNRPPLPTEWWGEPSWHEFEGLRVPLPHDYDSFLRFYFKDYMKLPPKDKQKPTHDYPHRCDWCYGPTVDGSRT